MSQKEKKNEILPIDYTEKQITNKKMKYLDKETNLMSLAKFEESKIQEKEELSAVRELLEINDYNQEDWNNHTLNNDSNAKKSKGKRKISRNNQESGYFKDTVENLENEPQAQEIWIDTNLENIFVKKQSHERLYQTERNIESKKTQDSEKTNKNKEKIVQTFRNNSYFMNRTNYWKSPSKVENKHELSLTQKLRKNLTTQELFHKSHSERESFVQSRPDRIIDFGRSKSSFVKNENEFDSEKYKEPKQQSKSITIYPNKAITVRQMLEKIKSNEEIDLSNVSNSEYKPRKRRFRSFRQPFESFNTKNIERKNFIPFRIEEERKIEYSLNKLEERLQRNPELNKYLNEVDLRLLEKPTYCPWVERNKEKIRVKKTYPLTVRPLKMVD